MKRLQRLLSTALVASLVGAAPLVASRAAFAQAQPTMLVVGNEPLFLIRTDDTLNGQEWTVQDRINHVHDVMAKYLGGQFYKFTTKEWGDRVHIYLNKEFLLAVTPEDAAATHHKTADTLAPIWVKHLERGFQLSHTR